MKILALVFCFLAVTSASYLASPYYGGYAHGYGYHGPQHLPVIGPGGVPLEPPANVAARAQHAAAVAEAKARNGDYYGYGGYAGAYGYGHGGYHGPQHIPVIGPLGVPLEPPANVAARAQHAAAHAEAAAHSSGHLYGLAGGLYGAHGLYGLAGYGHGYGGALHIPVIGPHGVPLEPPANVAARAQHAAAHAAAAAHSGAYHHWRKRRSIYGAAYYGHGGYHGPQHIPIIGPGGVPLEPPANVAARAQHAAAHANAAHGGLHTGALAVYAPAAYAGYAGIAAVGAHGPLDTPEVAAAKAAHFAAHAEARARTAGHGYAGLYGGYAPYGLAGLHHGLPVDTPEVAVAKAAHLAAHAAIAHGSHY